MKKAIRCCISCILPCGSLDVIRIVHANGRVEEISGRTVRAYEVMKAYPKHVLKKPSSNEWIEAGDVYANCDDKIRIPRIVILPPDAQLERGKIYFLMPLPPAPVPPPKRRQSQQGTTTSTTGRSRKLEASEKEKKHQMKVRPAGSGGANCDSKRGQGLVNNESKHQMSLSLLSSSTSSDQYLSELLSEEKLSNQRERRRGRVGVWRPHLDSICESESPPPSET